MVLRVKRIEYFEWALSDELIDLLEKDRDNATPHQNLVDDFFSPDDLSVAELSDPYYEFDGEI